MKEEIIKIKYSIYILINNFGHITNVTLDEYEALLIKLKEKYKIEGGEGGSRRIYKKDVVVKIHKDEQINLK